MKIELNLIAATLKKHEVEPIIARKIIEDLQVEAGPEEEKAPPIPKKYVLLVNQNIGWAVQIPEEEREGLVLGRISDAAAAYNATPKGHKFPATSIGTALELVPPKITKELNLWVKTREPVYVVQTDNTLPAPD